MTTPKKHYVNQFKSCIMNRLVSSVPCTLEATYEQLKEEIGKQVGRNQGLEHLDEAYALVHEEIFGKPSVSSIDE